MFTDRFSGKRRFMLARMFLVALAFSDSRGSSASAEEITVSIPPAPATSDRMMDSAIPYLSRPGDQSNQRLSAYHADADGRWTQPRVPSTESPTIADPTNRRGVPLLLTTPSHRIRLELAVSINGLSPEQLQQQFLASVIAAATDAPAEISTTAAEEPTQTETVTATTYHRDSVAAKLQRLVEATDADEEELSWMLQQWRPGPLWLIARDAVSPPPRATEPLVRWLDANHDGVLDQNEFVNIPKRWKRIDTNRDRVIEKQEIASAVERNSQDSSLRAPDWNWNLAWEGMNRTDHAMMPDPSQSNMPPRSNVPASSKTPDSCETPDSSKIDVELNISDDQQALTLRSDDFRLHRTGNQLALAKHPLSGTTIRCSAYTGPQRSDAQFSEAAAAQISIAARLEPTPLWNTLDRDGDGRLTQLERRSASEHFADLDQNSDQKITSDEWPITIELVICQGTEADELLASETRWMAQPDDPTNATVPDWFAGMDANRDKALSRDEFLGSTKQFKQYDQNNDGLVTASEIASINQ